MQENKVQLILSDIDGTILDDNHQIDRQLPMTIQKLKEKELPFILASARSPKGIIPLAQALGLIDFPIVCYNGALIIESTLRRNQFIAEHPLREKEVVRIISELKENFPHVAINLYSGMDWIVEQTDEWVAQEMNITDDSPLHMSFEHYFDLKKHTHKLLLIEEAAVINQVQEYLESLNLPDVSIYLSKDNYLEVTSTHVSKEQALLDIADYYNIPLTNIMAFGDNFNDLPMIKRAGIGVAMGNAPEEVKQGADIVTDSNNEHGVTRIIAQYI